MIMTPAEEGSVRKHGRRPGCHELTSVLIWACSNGFENGSANLLGCRYYSKTMKLESGQLGLKLLN